MSVLCAILVMQERWQICEVKPGPVGLVLGWVTTWEYLPG